VVGGTGVVVVVGTGEKLKLIPKNIKIVDIIININTNILI
jgi:hypothetical protein